MDELADAIEAELRTRADADRAVHERAYLKSDLDFLGVRVPDIRRVVKGVVARHPGLDQAAVLALAEALWSVPIHERRMAAVELLVRYKDALDPEAMVVIERFLREARTWALVDGLAANAVGLLVVRHPQLNDVLDRWVTDADFWLRRAAVLALLVPLREGDGDPDRFFRYADQLLEENEFFIRKAVGWVLRDMSRRRPALVRDWLEPRVHRASGVTMREAVKYLDSSDREHLLASYRAERRPRD